VRTAAHVTLRRRELLKSGALAAGALALGPGFWRQAFAQRARPGPGPYGPLGPADSNGIRLPRGFSSRRIAQGLLPVVGTGYVWHLFSDGQATYPTSDGGFILVSNSEVPVATPGRGGASAIRFRPDGTIADAYRILGNTSNNCAGGGTPWGTWMSCEEHDAGLVWECDPAGVKPAVPRPAMGVFSHEAICVDPVGRRIYLSEDDGDGRFYRFTPERYPDCSAGLLEVATVAQDGAVTWTRVPDPSAASAPTRQQVKGSTRFRRGEGIWFDSGIVYLATTGDNRVHAYNTGTETIEVAYDGNVLADPPIKQVDNVTVSPSGDLFVCEDPGDIAMGIVTPEGEAARFLQVVGPGQVNPVATDENVQSEITGVIFDPSGKRMFFSAQRSFVVGVIYEVTGPFRLERPRDAKPPPLRVSAPDKVRLTTFSRRGLSVGVRLGEDARLTATVRARLPVRRGGATKRRNVTLARRRLEEPAFGQVDLKLRPSRAKRETLRGRRSLRATVEVTAVDAAGNRSVVERRLALSRR
jgi:hypothetical protein